MKIIIKRGVSLLLIGMLFWSVCGIGIGYDSKVLALKASALTLKGGVTFTAHEHPNEIFTRTYTTNDGVKHEEQVEYSYTTYTLEHTNPMSVAGASDYVSHIKSGHPRLYVNDFGTLLDRIDQDYMSAKFYNSAKSTADKYLDEDPLELVLTERNTIKDVSSAIQLRVIPMILTFKIEQEKYKRGRADAMEDYRKYLTRLAAELTNISNYRHWGHSAFLCTAEISATFALAYDWLYDDVKPTTREAWRDACYAQGMVPYLYNYTVAPTGTNFPDTETNWNLVCNGSAIMTGIAFYDASDAVLAPVCKYLIERGAECMWNGLIEYEDGGFYREGLGYWDYATRHLCYGINAYESAVSGAYTFPERFSHASAPGVSTTAEFPIYMNGINGAFNFGDCDNGFVNAESMYYLSNRFNKPEYTAYMNNVLLLNGSSFNGMKAVFALLWYQPRETSFDSLSKLALDKAHVSESDINILSMRSAFDITKSHTDNAFTAMQGGSNTARHMGLSMGTFVLDMNGKRFVRQLGRGNYAWPGYHSSANVDSPRYTYYVMRAEGNNTIIANPGLSGEQNKNAMVKIIESGSSTGVGYGIIDMTSTNDVFTKAHRGLMLTDDRSRVVLQDEITTSSPSEIYWFAHTGPESAVSVSLSAKRKRATLTCGDQTIYATITNGPTDAVFEYVDALPLSTSPNPSVQVGKDYGKKLQIHMSNVSNVRLTVEFSTVSAVTESGTLEVKPLNQWSSLLAEASAEDNTDYLSQKRYTKAWYNDVYRHYIIHDDEELAGVAYLVNNGITDFSGKRIKLADDITLSDTLEWTPIGTSEHPFKGTFDGGQRTVSGLHFDKKAGRMLGLFGKTQDAILKNVCIDSPSIHGASDIGALVGFAKDSEIYNIYVHRAQLSGNMRLGSIVGTQTGGCIKNSSMNGAVLGSSSMYGGICGYTEEALIDNCNACVRLTEKQDTDGSAIGVGSYYGGIAGFAAYSSVMNSYYYHSNGTIAAWNTKAVSDGSYNLTPNNGKYNATNSVSANMDNTLPYAGGSASVALKTLMTRWINAQTESGKYLAWELVDETDVYGAKPVFVPETTDELQLFNYFSFSSVTIADGKVATVLKNMCTVASTGYLVVVQKKGDQILDYALRSISLNAKAKKQFDVDLVSNKVTDVQVFVLDNPASMKLKSAIVDLPNS